MDDLIKQLKGHKDKVYLVAGLVAFALMAFFPSIDFIGKAQEGAFEFISDAFDGNASGCALILIITLIAMLGAAVVRFIKKDTDDKQMTIYFGVSAILCIISSIALPKGVSFTAFAWIAFIILGAATFLAYQFSQDK